MSSVLPSFRPSDYLEGSYICDPIPIGFFDGKDLQIVLDGVSEDKSDFAEYENAVANFLEHPKEYRDRSRPKCSKTMPR